MARQIINHISNLEQFLHKIEMHGFNIKLSEVLYEIKQIRLLSIKSDLYELSKCVEFCFDKIKDWSSDSNDWQEVQIQFLFMTLSMTKGLVNTDINCDIEAIAIKSYHQTDKADSYKSEELAGEALELLDRSLKMIYMCLSLKSSSFQVEKNQELESYLKSELLHILKKKNSLKQYLHHKDSRSNIKAYV